MTLPTIDNRDKLIRSVQVFGFLPFFSGPIPGYSIVDVVPCDFLFPRDAYGEKKYSYSVTVYDVPERWLGEEAVTGEYKTDPKESFRRIREHLRKVLPAAEETDILKMIR